LIYSGLTSGICRQQKHKSQLGNTIWDVVNGAYPCPEEKITIKEKEAEGSIAKGSLRDKIREWTQANFFAILTMRKNCEEAALSKFSMKRTAKEVWNTLKFLYEGKTVTDYGMLLCRISKLTYNDRESTIKAHISEYKRPWNYFSSILATSELSKNDDGFGAALQQLTRSGQAKAELLLQTIPSFYSNTVENIRSKEGYNYGDPARKLILYIPVRQKGNALTAVAGSANDPVILATNTKNLDNGNLCRYCKEVKGWVGKGHEESECFTKKREEKEAKKVEAKHEDGKIEDEYITIVEVGKFEDEQGWQYDTGASTHTTKQKYRLKNARPTDTKWQDMISHKQRLNLLEIYKFDTEEKYLHLQMFYTIQALVTLSAAKGS
jgi:hypothetical protein